MRSTQAVPRSLGGAPARSTARPHPHQACGIQTETCTQGQRSCLLCHMPSEGRLTNKSQPARSKQVQSAQPARHKTSPQHSTRKSKSSGWRLCGPNLAPRQFLFQGRKVLVSFFGRISLRTWTHLVCLPAMSDIGAWPATHRSQTPDSSFKPSIADDKLFLFDLCWLLYGIFLSPFVNSYNIRKCLDLLFALFGAEIETTQGCYAMLWHPWTHPNWPIELPMAEKRQAHRANCRNVQPIQDGSWRTKSRLRGTTLLQDRCLRNQSNLTIVDAKGFDCRGIYERTLLQLMSHGL